MKKQEVRKTADNVEMQGIQFQITNDSAAASQGLQALAEDLKKLRSATSGSTKALSNVAQGIASINKTLNGINTGSFQIKMQQIGASIDQLQPKVGGLKISSSISNQLSAINAAIDGVDVTASSKLTALADGLRPLTELGKSNLSSFTKQLEKLPVIMQELDNTDIGKFSQQMQDLASAMKPFADEMQKVSNGFSALPIRIQKLITSTEKYNQTVSKSTGRNRQWANSFSQITKYLSIAKIADLLGKAIDRASEYQETLNLFTVSMGDYGQAAYEYAQKVSAVMGIDPAEWMQKQGVFNTIIAGFGVAADKAAIMSQNLTQLGYDLSSFYNIGVTEAMQKVQSGISGELEPLRNLGYDLSVARLQQEALNLGIEKSVSDMTQAEKSQLRYHAILTQVTVAQGDMARTLENPANMLRILRAQLELVAREIGNIFIPVLTKVLPVCIAVAQAIREIITAIASLFGVTLQTPDWQKSIGSAVSGSSAIEDNMDGAAGAAKKLSAYLSPFDELNVLPDSSSGGGGSGVSAGGGGFDIDPISYDFLGNAVSKNVDKIYKKLQKIVNPIKKIIGFLKEYDYIVKAGLGVIAMGVLLSKLGAIKEVLKNLHFADTFIHGFQFIKGTGGNILQSLRGGIDNVRMSLSKMQKAAITVVAGFAEFYVIKNSVKDLALGCENATSKIVQIGVAATAAAAAMYVALGPAGLAVAGAVALIGALAGVSAAQQEVLDKMSDDAFYTGTGAKIGDITSRYVGLMNAIVDTNQPIIDNQANIADLKESIDSASSSIGNISTAILDGAYTASEKIPEIKSTFETLQSDTASYMDEIYDNIVLAIGGSFGDALQRAGKSIPEILSALRAIKGEGENTLASLQTRLSQLYDDVDSGKITNEDFAIQLRDIKTQMDNLTGTTDETVNTFGSLKDSMRDISWDSEEEKSNFFAQVTEASQNAKESVNQSYDSISQSLESFKSLTTDSSMKKLVDEMISINESDRQAQLASIDNQLSELFDAVQKDMIEKTQKVQDDASKAWDDMGWLQKAFAGGSKDAYVRSALQNYQNNVVSPVSDEIEQSMEKIGVDGSAWASDAMSEVINSLFDLTANGDNGVTRFSVQYAMTLDDAIDQAFKSVGESGSNNSKDAGKQIVSGLANGIKENTEYATRSMSGLVDSMDKATRDAAKIHSPSKLFATDGQYMIDGIIKGVNDRVSSLKNTMASAVKSAFSASSADSAGYSYGRTFADAICRAIRNTNFPTIRGSVSASNGSAKISFNAYAAGGFPGVGELFMARENGIPEMVGSIGSRTAVANNDQIVEAVSDGVYRAVAAAMGEGGGRNGGGQVVTAKVNGKTLFEVVVDQARSETVRTGRNPLLDF